MRTQPVPRSVYSRGCMRVSHVPTFSLRQSYLGPCSGTAVWVVTGTLRFPVASTEAQVVV